MKIKIGILGCGRIASHYKKIFNEKIFRDAFEICVVCDVRLDAAISFSEIFESTNVSRIDDFSKYVNTIDLVLVLTPSGMHFDHCSKLLKMGFNVLCEKPTVMTPEQGEAISILENKTGKFCATVFQNRLNPPIQYLKSSMETENIGKALTVSVRLQWCRYQNYYEDGWHGTWKMDGGVLNQQAIHHLDAMRWIVGDVHRVCAIAGRKSNILEAEDTISVLLEFQNGTFGTFEATTATRPEDLEASLTVLTDRGKASIGGIALNNLLEWNFNGNVVDQEVKRMLSEDVPTGYGLSHRRVLLNLAADIKKNVNPQVSISDSLKTVKLVHAIYSSVEQNSWVYLDDNPTSKLLGN